jgi:hypothetical protein
MASGNPIVAKIVGIQSQGSKREAVVFYCERLPKRDLESLRLFSVVFRVEKMA